MEVKALEDQLKALADQTRKVMQAVNQEVPDDFKQKVIDNIYKDVAKKPSDITLRQSISSKDSPLKRRKSASVDKFTAIVAKFLGI